MASTIKSKATLRTEAEYLSSNQHHSFQESNSRVKVNPNPCKDGKLCRQSIAIANGTTCNNNTSNNAKTKLKKERTAGNPRPGRKKGFQVHLKKEDGDFKNEAIEYNIEFPNRVAVRMEFLMQTTKVRLNDRDFMDNLYAKLIGEESKNLHKTTEMREAIEANRVKKLVIDGKMPPPSDMLYLYDHPVFRVNAMLRRLDQHNKDIFGGPKHGENLKITPVEPYEYDGNQFFRYLHEHGKLWIPEEERIAEEEKIAGKIARAKLRLLEKRSKEAEQEKMMRLLYADNKGAYLDDNENGKDSDDDSESKLRRNRRKKLSEMKILLLAEAEKRAARYKRRKEFLERKEKERKARVLKRQKERDYVFLQDREKERTRLVKKHISRMATKTLSNLGSFANQESIERSPERLPFMDYKRMFEDPPTPPTLKEDESFKRIRKAYHVSGSNKLSKYRPSVNQVIARYIDPAKTPKELFHFGNHVTKLYNREQSTADDFMIKLNRML